MKLTNYTLSEYHKKYVKKLTASEKELYWGLIVPSILYILQNTTFKIEHTGKADGPFYVLNTVVFEETKTCKKLIEASGKEGLQLTDKLKNVFFKHIKGYLNSEAKNKTSAEQTFIGDFKSMLFLAFKKKASYIDSKIPEYASTAYSKELEKSGKYENEITFSSSKSKE